LECSNCLEDLLLLRAGEPIDCIQEDLVWLAFSVFVTLEKLNHYEFEIVMYFVDLSSSVLSIDVSRKGMMIQES
jgi:hypothetical protein